MGKTVTSVVGVVLAVAIAIALPPLGGAAALALGVSGSVGIALVTAAVGVALSVGAGLIMKTLMGKPSAQAAGPPQVFNQSLTDSFIIYGRRRTSFLKWVFFHPKKVGKKHFRYFVFAVAGHRCQGALSWFLNEEPVTVDGSGMVTTGPYAGKVWLWFQRGLENETANATFVSECDGKWTTDHRGDGIAAIYMKAEMSDAVVQAGFCTPSAIVEGKDDILDPRDGLRKYTRNATLVYYDWMRTPREEGGFGLYPEEVPDDAFIAANANVCDETVDDEERYALDALIVTGAAPSEIRDVMVANCAGSRTYSSGKEIMRPGYWVPPTATLEEDDLAGPIVVSPFLSADASVNEVQGSYVNPDDGYQGAPLPTQSVAAADVRQVQADLAMVTSAKRGVRILRIFLKQAQYEKTVTWPMNIKGLKVKALDSVQINANHYGLSNYIFKVMSWRFSPDWGLVLSLREENEDIYTDGAISIPAPPPTIDRAEPVLRLSDLLALIDTSKQVGLTVTATDTSVTLSNHTRRYNDFDVAVTGGTITGLTANTNYWIYYEDEEREGGAVTYYATTTYFDAFPSPTYPTRHYAGYIRTDVVGGTGTTGGGSLPPGGGGSNPYTTDSPP